MDWHNKQILIFGKGKSGRAAYARLEGLGAVPVYYDDAPAVEEGRQYSAQQVQSAHWDCAVLSPAVRPDNPMLLALEKKGVPTLSEIDLGWTLFGGKTIAITGTNGKTTTVRQTEKLLCDMGVKARAVGNVGLPFCAVDGDIELAVVEISSFQCHQSVLFAPDVAVITNLAPDHVEWHGSLAAYRAAKCKLLDMSKTYALNVDDPDLIRVADKPCYPYSLTDTSTIVFVEGREVCVRDHGKVHRVAKVDELPLRGNHNLYNVLCALTLTVAAVGYSDTFRHSLLSFKGERMRVEQLTTRRPYVYNDSKGTNTAATIAAMRQMVGETVLLLGGWDKGEDFTRLFMQLPAGTALVTFGQAGTRITCEAERFGIADVTYEPTLSGAVRVALSKDKDNVLFSPACSSFDAYTSYVERGLDFEREISRYFG